MARHQSHHAGAPERRRSLVALAWLLGCCAVLASVAWVPAMAATAHALRYQLDSTATSRDPGSLTLDEARQHMWLIAIVSFLVIVALAAAALVAGRRALRVNASVQTLARLELGAIGSLTAGLVIWLVPFFLYAVDRYFSVPEGVSVQLASIALAGAEATLILGGIAVRQNVAAGPGQAARQQARRTWARICLAVAPLIILTLFFGTAVYAQFIVGFFLHFVY